MEHRVKGAIEDELTKACLSPERDACNDKDGYFKGICEVKMATKRPNVVNCNRQHLPSLDHQAETRHTTQGRKAGL